MSRTRMGRRVARAAYIVAGLAGLAFYAALACLTVDRLLAAFPGR